MKTLFIAVCLAVMCAGASASCRVLSYALVDCNPQINTFHEAQRKWMEDLSDVSREGTCSALAAVDTCITAAACPDGRKDEYLENLQKQRTGFEC